MPDQDDREHLLDLTLDELRDRWVERGLPRYRAEQVFEWIYQKRKTDFDQMTNLSKDLRQDLSRSWRVLAGCEITRQESRDGTVKLLLEFGAGQRIETVLIPAGDRLTACLSTQFGCPVRCAFCATGQAGFSGNLSTGQIIEQLLRLQMIADEDGRRIGNVVLMGMGEPLLNYENVLKAVRIINSPYSLHIAARHITLSTVGVPEQMRRLAGEGLQITLAISLHSANQAVRETLIPLAKKHPLKEVIDAARHYFDVTGREITIEYLLLEEVNLSDDDAEKLASLAQSIRANVNLIAFNPVAESAFGPPDRAVVQEFAKKLRQRGVNVNLRASKGADIDAACGQLRKRHSPSS